MKEMTWKSRLNRLFAHRFALPVLCWCAALVFWLVQGAVAFAGDSSAKAKGTLTETSIPIESWQLAELTWARLTLAAMRWRKPRAAWPRKRWP